jgi:hypothetical protein
MEQGDAGAESEDGPLDLFRSLGIQLTGKCDGDLGCQEQIADTGKCKNACSVGAMRQTLSELAFMSSG